jgi:hypothetical protein
MTLAETVSVHVSVTAVTRIVVTTGAAATGDLVKMAPGKL